MAENKKVWVGMSGGVDSSVAALLLLKKGYLVTGVTLKLRDADMQKDIDDAKNVCNILGIKHIVLDFTKLFEESVIDYFTDEYLSGRTPNPCVICNQKMKFGVFLDSALKHGADFIATGHFARVEYNSNSKRYMLYRTETKKDQSYVLYGLTQYQLSHTLFPLSNMTKEEVRKTAKDNKLPVANKGDSMEICFVPNGRHTEYIEKKIGRRFTAGNFVDEEGNILGHHKGIARYTIGQRKGLGIAFGQPMYVVGIDAEKNEVILGKEGRQYSSVLLAENFNYISIDVPEKPIKIQAKIRYQASPADAVLVPLDGGKVKITFEQPQRSVTPGQAVVFYDKNLVLGGGIII